MKSKRAAGICLAAGIAGASLTGCYAKLTQSEYSKTVGATFGSTNIYFDEINYYVKMNQVTYDYYFENYYAYYTSYKTLKEFYEGTDLTTGGKTMWESLKQSSLQSLWQTYALVEFAKKNNITLTAEEQQKVSDAVDEYFHDTDTGIIEAMRATRELTTKVITDNALANKVYTVITDDIDTTVNDADFRYTEIAYVRIAAAPADTTAETTTAADETEAGDPTETTQAEETKTIGKDELMAMGDTVLSELKTAVATNKSNAAETVKKLHESDKDYTFSSSESAIYGKPAEDATESISTWAWNNLKTGDYDKYYDETNSACYVVYCVNDDNAKSKASAIETELENRRADKFKEKYKAIADSGSVFSVKEKLLAQYDFAEIKYSGKSAHSEEETTAETTTTAEATTAETTTEAPETSEDVTLEPGTDSETTQEPEESEQATDEEAGQEQTNEPDENAQGDEPTTALAE